jgi:hypothetical protein
MKLAAADTEDLEMLSARLQDAVGRLKDFAWLPRQRRFACVLNRYRWEDSRPARGSRVRSGLKFDGVLDVKSLHIKRGAQDAVVSLLAIKFRGNAEQVPDNNREDPGGVIELLFAGGGVIRLTVECIDAELSDLTGPWEARARPSHEGGS